MTDFLGKELNPGDYFVRCYKQGSSASLKIGKIISIRERTDHWIRDVEILSKGASKTGWTYSSNLVKITEEEATNKSYKWIGWF